MVTLPKRGKLKDLMQDVEDAINAGGGGGGAVDSVNGQTGVVVLDKSDIGLSNVDNTSDANKPVSTATQTALDLKADINNPIFTGTVTLPAGQSINGVTLTAAGSASNYLRENGTYGSIGSNIDGGSAASVYGGATTINGGGA